MPPKRGRPKKQSSRGRGGSSSSRVPPTIFLDDETWEVRPKNIDLFEPGQEYAGKDGLFSIAMHHGGVFHNRVYVGGTLSYVDQCSTNAFNLFELSSIMVALGYSRNLICEWYYGDPRDSVIGPTYPLIDEADMVWFLAMPKTPWKLVHVYALEITHAEAILRCQQDQEKFMNELSTVKSTIVIEEINEPEVPRPKPTPRVKRKVKPLQLDWYEKDEEFEEFMQNSLEEARK